MRAKVTGAGRPAAEPRGRLGAGEAEAGVERASRRAPRRGRPRRRSGPAGRAGRAAGCTAADRVRALSSPGPRTVAPSGRSARRTYPTADRPRCQRLAARRRASAHGRPQRRGRADAEHLAQRHPRRLVAARPVHRRAGRGRGRGQVDARRPASCRCSSGAPAGRASAAASPRRWRCPRPGSWGSTASIWTAFFVTRSTTVSRNPGANRSIWFSIASVMSTSEPCGTCT